MDLRRTHCALSLRTETVMSEHKGDNRAVDHVGHRIVVRPPDMAGRPVVICVTCNQRLNEDQYYKS